MSIIRHLGYITGDPDGDPTIHTLCYFESDDEEEGHEVVFDSKNVNCDDCKNDESWNAFTFKKED